MAGTVGQQGRGVQSGGAAQGIRETFTEEVRFKLTLNPTVLLLPSSSSAGLIAPCTSGPPVLPMTPQGGAAIAHGSQVGKVA